MSHKGIRLLLQDVAQSLGDDILVVYGRDTDFNMMREKRFKSINISPLVKTAEYAVDGITNYSRVWNVNMAFYAIDTIASLQEEYTAILDQTDEMVDKFINKLNFYTEQSDIITLSGMTMTPFIKATADVLSGQLLSFSLTQTDDFNYCGLDDC